MNQVIKFSIGVLFMMFLFSCGSDDKKTDDENVQTAQLEIKGMTCEMGCGGKICSELKEIDGVAGTDLKFDENNPIDMVTVSFNPDMVSQEDLVKKVEGIMDGAYSVTGIN